MEYGFLNLKKKIFDFLLKNYEQKYISICLIIDQKC